MVISSLAPIEKVTRLVIFIGNIQGSRHDLNSWFHKLYEQQATGALPRKKIITVQPSLLFLYFFDLPPLNEHLAHRRGKRAAQGKTRVLPSCLFCLFYCLKVQMHLEKNSMVKAGFSLSLWQLPYHNGLSLFNPWLKGSFP
jgi:hypothetical protein